ncbi:hypothetical protein H6504_03210 [Candidatus Woesearchaeota archaeon]|nr:hypothetical protein [Candidatus Woesearchaeota archaeon]
MILGLIILIALAIVFYAQSSQTKKTETQIARNLALEPEKLNVYLAACLEESARERVLQVAYQGGLLNRTGRDTVQYYNESYLFHCRHEPGHGCVNELISRNVIENDLNTYIQRDVTDCINLTSYRDLDYNVQDATPVVDVSIGVNQVFVNMDYRIRLAKDDFSITSEHQLVIVDSDLGYMHDLGVQILKAENEQGFFDQDEWMRYNGDTLIEKYRPYPHTIYRISKINYESDEHLVYRFAIEGFDTAEYRGNPDFILADVLYDYCITPDKNCHSNVADVGACTSPLVDGKMNKTAKQCPGTSDILLSAGKSIPRALRYEAYCNPDGTCDDCGDLLHGESRCVYDGPAGDGYDYVGSRHYKETCINGVVLSEPCRDYREELCTEDPIEMTAMCRVNRWEDCILQTDRISCENTTIRDCSWSDELLGQMETYGIKRDQNLCHPQVPPGLKHWRPQDNKVCEMASEWRECDGFECPSQMNERVNLNCMFQADCGVARNVADEVTFAGLMTTNTNEVNREGIGYFPPGYMTRYDASLQLGFSTLRPEVTNAIYESYEEGKFERILERIEEFADEASGWDECTFCDCDWGIPHDCEYDKLSVFGTICSPWQAPGGGDNCFLCEADFSKPCTEYLCKSLGQGCTFREENGVGYCDGISSTDEQGPTMEFGGILTPEMTSMPTVNLLGVETIFLCKGADCNDDIGIPPSDGVEPYSELEVMINLSEPASCKSFPVNVFEYEDIPQIFPTKTSHAFNTTYVWKETAKSKIQLWDYLTTLTGFGLMYALTDIDRVRLQVEETVTKVVSLMSDLGQDPTPVLDFYQNFMANIYFPLRDFLDEYEDQMFATLFDLQNDHYTSYIKCIDANGNTQIEDLAIMYAVGKDSSPPVIVGQEPTNLSYIKAKEKIKLWFDEPVECRWDYAPAPFFGLQHKLDCPRSVFDLREQGYSCNGTIELIDDKEIIYVTCLDQPRLEEEYEVIFYASTSIVPLGIPSSGYISIRDSPSELAVLNSKIMKKDPTRPVGFYVPNNFKFTMMLDREMLCRYDTDPEKSFNEMASPFTDCHLNNCTTEMNVATDAIYHIRCINKLADVTRNENNYELWYQLK